MALRYLRISGLKHFLSLLTLSVLLRPASLSHEFPMLTPDIIPAYKAIKELHKRSQLMNFKWKLSIFWEKNSHFKTNNKFINMEKMFGNWINRRHHTKSTLFFNPIIHCCFLSSFSSTHRPNKCSTRTF